MVSPLSGSHNFEIGKNRKRKNSVGRYYGSVVDTRDGSCTEMKYVFRMTASIDKAADILLVFQ